MQYFTYFLVRANNYHDSGYKHKRSGNPNTNYLLIIHTYKGIQTYSYIELTPIGLIYISAK